MAQPTRPDLYLDTLRNLAFGQTAEDASKALHKCVQRSIDTGKNSTLTLKITIKPVGNRSGQLEFHDSITVKMPEVTRGGTLMFTTPEGNITRTNPNQSELNLRSVDTHDPIKKIENS